MTTAAPRTRAGDGTGSALEASTRLERLADLATRAGASPLARDARELSARLAEGRFYVACFGQFKRGKSTLLNALLGEELLPVGVVPVTAVVTVLRHGVQRAARVRLCGQSVMALRAMKCDPPGGAGVGS